MAVTPIWPAGSNVNEQGEITFHGRAAESLLNEFGSPLYVIDTDEVRDRATKFVHSAANAFNNTVTHVSFAGKALLSKEICRIVTESGMLIDTCSMGEMRIALAAGVPGRRLVLHGNNKSDAEIELAITEASPKSWWTSRTSGPRRRNRQASRQARSRDVACYVRHSCGRSRVRVYRA